MNVAQSKITSVSTKIIFLFMTFLRIVQMSEESIYLPELQLGTYVDITSKHNVNDGSCSCREVCLVLCTCGMESRDEMELNVTNWFRSANPHLVRF